MSAPSPPDPTATIANRLGGRFKDLYSVLSAAESETKKAVPDWGKITHLRNQISSHACAVVIETETARKEVLQGVRERRPNPRFPADYQVFMTDVTARIQANTELVKKRLELLDGPAIHTLAPAPARARPLMRPAVVVDESPERRSRSKFVDSWKRVFRC